MSYAQAAHRFYKSVDAEKISADLVRNNYLSMAAEVDQRDEAIAILLAALRPWADWKFDDVQSQIERSRVAIAKAEGRA